MAHNIARDRNTGMDMVFTAGALPWHKLGQNVAEAQTWEQAMELALLNWNVVSRPLSTSDGSLVASHKAIIREDQPETILGIVGKDYQIIDNYDAFKWTEALLGAGARYESAGALGNGSRIWVMARVPAADFAIGDDQHQSFLLFTTAHDGNLSATAMETVTRVVCQNTLNAALAGNGANLRIRHTRSAQERFDAAVRMIGNTVQTSATLAENLSLLASKRLTKETYVAVLDKLFPQEKEVSKAAVTRRDGILADITKLFESNDGNAFPEQRGTGYNLLQAITGYVDHTRATRVTVNTRELSLVGARAQSAMFGGGAELKTMALSTLLSVTADLPTFEPAKYFPAPVVAAPVIVVAPVAPVVDVDTPEVSPVVACVSSLSAVEGYLKTLRDSEERFARQHAIWMFRNLDTYGHIPAPGITGAMTLSVDRAAEIANTLDRLFAA